MLNTVAVAKALYAVIVFLNSLYSLIRSRMSEADRAKLDAAIAQAKKSKTVDEAADAAQKINDSF